jgi:3',5'-cyclic-nucleotide phosphodiesterase
VDLHVVGCHGGETPKHRTCAFVLDDTLAIDAGSLTSGLDLAAQSRLEACVISHAHLDHVRDLATLADNRCQMGLPPLVVAGTRETIRALRKHFFNNVLWPDFAAIPSAAEPTIEYLELRPERQVALGRFKVRPVLVNHSIESAGFVIEGAQGGAIAYSGDTGPTDRLFEVLNAERDLRALLMEVSFPSREQRIATASGHHTPRTLAADLAKLRTPKDLPTLLYHIKPFFQAEVERECAALEGYNLQVLDLEDHFVL